MAGLSTVGLLAPVWVGGLPPGVPRTISVSGSGVLLGTDRGLYRTAATGYEPLFTRDPVLDLAAGGGAVWFVAEGRLYEWIAPSRVLSRPVGTGLVHAVDVGPDGTVWVATSAGLYRSDGGERGFIRVPGDPMSDVRSVRALETDVWAATPGTLWRGSPEDRFVAVRRGLVEGWWEMVAVVPDEGGLLLVVPRGIWRVGSRGVGGVGRAEIGVAPVRAAVRLEDTLWVATREGLFAMGLGGAGSAGPVEPSPVLAVDAFDVEARDGRLWVASRKGIVTLRPRSDHAASRVPGLYGPERRDEVGRIQRAVLAHLGISPRRLEDLERRARWAGLWPTLRASITADRDRGHDRDRDETVTGGALWRLSDSERERASDFRLEVALEWDLATLYSPAYGIGVSRERREVVELAERLLDRVNRTYFERERLIAELEALPNDSEAERSRLTLRVRELTATLDGWTGGTVSRRFPRPGPGEGRPP